MRNFIKIINALDMIITSDTLALHIAAVLNKRIVSFFGPTSAEEIELYGNGVKIKPDSDCYCCFQKIRNKDVMCIDKIKTENLIESALKQIEYIRK
jgi:heptosyltransferase-2